MGAVVQAQEKLVLLRHGRAGGQVAEVCAVPQGQAVIPQGQLHQAGQGVGGVDGAAGEEQGIVGAVPGEEGEAVGRGPGRNGDNFPAQDGLAELAGYRLGLGQFQHEKPSFQIHLGV